jgi:predicted ester cyclase
MRSMSIVTLFVIIIATPILAQEVGGDPASRNREILRQYSELIRSGQYDRAAAFWSSDAINNGRPMKPDAIRTILEDMFRIFPDYRSEVMETLVQGDAIVTMSRVTGTHLGVAQTTFNGGLLKGAKPTGKRFEVLQTHWWKFKDGKIVWHQGVRDDLSMMRQLGLIPDELPVGLREVSTSELIR